MVLMSLCVDCLEVIMLFVDIAGDLFTISDSGKWMYNACLYVELID